MIITINEDWRLASVPLQWTLQQHRSGSGESERWDDVGYFRDIDDALLELLHRQIRIWGRSDGANTSQCGAFHGISENVRTALAAVLLKEAEAYHGRAGR